MKRKKRDNNKMNDLAQILNELGSHMHYGVFIDDDDDDSKYFS